MAEPITDESLSFPALSSVESRDDALAYLQILGEKAGLAHEFGLNADYDWVDSDGGVGILDGFGSYAVVGGSESDLLVSTDSLIFQTSDILDLAIERGRVDVIFDPLVAQQININIDDGTAILHASTTQVYDIVDLTGDLGVSFQIGETLLTFDGAGKVELIDLVQDGTPELLFDGIAMNQSITGDGLVIEEAQALAPEGESTSTGSVADAIDNFSKNTTADSQDSFSISSTVFNDDVYVNYASIEAEMQLNAELDTYLSDNLDAEFNIISLPVDQSTTNETTQVYDQQYTEAQSNNSEVVGLITSLDDTSDLVFDDGLDLYFGL